MIHVCLHPIRVIRVTCVCSLRCTVYYTCKEHREMGNTGTEETQDRREGGSTIETTQVAWGRKGTGATD